MLKVKHQRCECRLDPLGIDRLSVHERHLQGVAVERKRGVDVLDGDADMVDRRQHGAGG